MYLEEFIGYLPLFYSYWEDQYFYLIIYILISFLITFVLVFVGFILSPKESNFEKLSSYECGFEPFGEAHSVFSIQFFLVGILFMLFDLEVAYLFPWVIGLGHLSAFGFFLMFFFLILLVIGFVYEWKKGALDWL